MPFVTEAHRNNPDMSIPGDRCYLVYKRIMDEWKKAPRWATVDRLFNDLTQCKAMCSHNKFLEPCSYCIAADLAWQVFFQLHVIPYELVKQKANGDI